MPYKVDRIDQVDSLFTTFVVYLDNQDKEGQEFNIPIWDADEFETKVKGYTKIDFDNWMNKAGKKNARPRS